MDTREVIERIGMLTEALQKVITAHTDSLGKQSGHEIATHALYNVLSGVLVDIALEQGRGPEPGELARYARAFPLETWIRDELHRRARRERET